MQMLVYCFQLQNNIPGGEESPHFICPLSQRGTPRWILPHKYNYNNHPGICTLRGLCDNFLLKYTTEVNYWVIEHKYIFKFAINIFKIALQNGSTMLHAYPSVDEVACPRSPADPFYMSAMISLLLKFTLFWLLMSWHLFMHLLAFRLPLI